MTAPSPFGQGSGSGTGAGFGSLRSHFLTGALAALLATPCSAPILGTAVGFALSRGSGEILSIFALLGLGLAFPYILVRSDFRAASWSPPVCC